MIVLARSGVLAMLCYEDRSRDLHEAATPEA